MRKRIVFPSLLLLACVAPFTAGCSGSPTEVGPGADASDDGSPPPPARDAAADATLDAGPDSASPPEAGDTDSGAIDSGSTDSDSGSSDSGSTDSGSIDSGDAAATDASDSGTDSGTEGPDSSTGDAGSDGSAVPPPPSGPGTTSTAEHNYAMHHIHLGDELDSTGKPDWTHYGYNLDGKITTAVSTDVCTQFAGANKKFQVDGPNGIDNSFGANIVGLIAAVNPNPSAAANTAFANGSVTTMLDVVGLTLLPSQTNTGLSANVFEGAPFGEGPNDAGAKPTFTVSDDWPLDPTSVTSAVNGNGTLVQPVTSKTHFAGAYITGGEFVSGASGALSLVLPFGNGGLDIVLPLQEPIVTFHHDATGHLSGGIIAGVIKTQDFVSSVQAIAGNINTALCSGTTLQQVLTSIEQTSDILSDGTNRSGVPCDGISIGVGFDADEIGVPQVAGQHVVTPNPCVDGG